MKKAIISLCVAAAVAFAFVGCDRGSGVAGVNISSLDGRKFEKTEMMGKTLYLAKLDPKNGFAANVNVVFEEGQGTLPTTDVYLKQSKGQYDTLGAKMQVQEKTDSTITLSGTMGGMKLLQRVLRDSAKNRFIVITGTYKEDSDKAAIEACVNSAGL